MASFPRYFRVLIASTGMSGRMLLIVLLTLQSVVAMADDCAFTHSDRAAAMTYLAQQTTETNNSAEHDDSAVRCDESNTKSHVEDDCTECGNNCCSCCLTLMHPVVLIQTASVSPDSLVFSFNSISVEAPYFAFLRPPKALIV